MKRILTTNRLTRFGQSEFAIHVVKHLDCELEAERERQTHSMARAALHIQQAS